MGKKPIPDNLRKPHDSDAWWLLRKIWDRVNRKNQHFMGVIVGPEGEGKSHTTIRLSNELDAGFQIEGRVIYDVVELLKALESGRHNEGDFYVLDEAGVQFGRRSWSEREQVIANQVLQIIRDENLGLFFTVPALGDLDTQTVRRLQAFYEITEWIKDQHVRGKWKWLDPDRADETGKIYKKYPRRRVDGSLHRITSVAFEPPPQELIKPYEVAKTAFQKRTYRMAIDELEEDQPEPELTPRDVVEMIEDDGGPQVYLKTANNGREYIDDDLIAYDYDISANKAKTVKKVLTRQLGRGEG